VYEDFSCKVQADFAFKEKEWKQNVPNRKWNDGNFVHYSIIQ
jgi:hypothetical protein